MVPSSAKASEGILSNPAKRVARSRMANPGGLEPPAAGLKVPCPADPGFTRGVRSDPAFERCHRFAPCLVHAGGTAPPVRRLSAAAVASPAHVRKWCSVEDLNPGMSVCRTDAFGRLANGAIYVMREGRFERPLSGV